MRPSTKILLGTCAVCTVAQGQRIARADDPTSNETSREMQMPRSDQAPLDRMPADMIADGATTSDRYLFAWSDDRMQTGIGVSAILGAGAVGFTDRTMRDTTASVGGLWDLRVTIGSHIPLALDLSYLGSVTSINGLPTGQTGTLVGTTAEAALRYNLLPHLTWNPYVFAGVGWQRYDVTRAAVSLSDSGMNDRDNLLEFPLGGGVAYRTGGFVADLRGTFRAAIDQNLVLTTPSLAPTSKNFAAMHTWEASAAVGYEF